MAGGRHLADSRLEQEGGIRRRKRDRRGCRATAALALADTTVSAATAAAVGVAGRSGSALVDVVKTAVDGGEEFFAVLGNGGGEGMGKLFVAVAVVYLDEYIWSVIVGGNMFHENSEITWQFEGLNWQSILFVLGSKPIS